MCRARLASGSEPPWKIRTGTQQAVRGLAPAETLDSPTIIAFPR